jgi:hypothetical protein
MFCLSTGKLSETSYLLAQNHICLVFLKHLKQQCNGEYILQGLPLDPRSVTGVCTVNPACFVLSIATSFIKFNKVNTNFPV